MICPSCEYDYVDNIKRCPDCGAELIPLEKFEGNLTHPSDYSVIYSTNKDYEAEMLKTNIESAGIKTIILSQKDKSFPTVGNLSVIKLLVKKTEANGALEIINDIESKELENEE